MNFTLGVFDVVGSAVPGFAYLFLASYVAERSDWLKVSALLERNAAVTSVAAALTAYAIGLLTYGVGRWLVRRFDAVFRGGKDTARTVFLARCPQAAGRPFVAADRMLLLAKIELVDPGAAVEITRVRASAVMLRGLVVPLAAGSVVAVVDGGLHGRWVEGLLAAAVLAVGSALALRRGSEMTGWAHQKTLELAYWIDGVDERLTGAQP